MIDVGPQKGHFLTTSFRCGCNMKKFHAKEWNLKAAAAAESFSVIRSIYKGKENYRRPDCKSSFDPSKIGHQPGRPWTRVLFRILNGSGRELVKEFGIFLLHLNSVFFV